MSDQKLQLTMSARDYASSPPSDSLLLGTIRTTHKKIWLRLRQNAHKFWLLEASASILSLLIFGTIVGILLYYNDNIYGASTAQSDGMKRPHIFPALAILSAIMRATMLLPVAAAISQLKWSWFRSSRRLIDIERFDEAAGGILGSAKLMYHLRFRNIAAVGAALTVLALPLDAIIQSAVLLPSKVTPVSGLGASSQDLSRFKSEVFLERATSYNASQLMTAGKDTWPETSMINAIQFGQGYANGLSDFLSAKTIVDCPTGYCEFKTTQTLSINYECVRRTDIRYAPTDGVSAPFQWLPGTNLRFYLEGNEYAEEQRIAAESYRTWPNETKYPTYKTDIFSITHGPLIVRTAMLINLGNGSLDETLTVSNGTYGIECALFWEVLTLQLYLNVSDPESNGTLSSKDTSTPFDVAQGDATQDALWLLTPFTCIVEDQVVPVSDDDYYWDNCIHLIGKSAGDGLQNMLTDSDYGLTGYLFLSKTYPNGTAKWNRRNLFAINMERTTWNQSPETAGGQIINMWANIAYATSCIVRRSESMTRGGSANLYVTGLASVLVFYYKIDWVRLAMPALIVLCCALFVLYTALLTRKEYAWRRSALPLLFHGLEDHERLPQGDLRDFNVMQDVAKEIRVTLTEHVDANGARFTTQH